MMISALAKYNRLHGEAQLKIAEQRKCVDPLRRVELQKEIDDIDAQLHELFLDAAAEQEAKDIQAAIRLNNGGKIF
jgi:hypothetical protein